MAPKSDVPETENTVVDEIAPSEFRLPVIVKLAEPPAIDDWLFIVPEFDLKILLPPDIVTAPV